MIRFKDFVREDADPVAQIRKIRDEMHMIRMKRELEKQKEALESMKKEKQKSGISTEYR
jgi:chromosome condensin MukBEF MukE localization factor